MNVFATLIAQWTIASATGTHAPFVPLFVALTVLPFAVGNTRRSLRGGSV